MTHNPLEDLAFDLQLDRLEEDAIGAPVDPQAVAAAMQRARSLLAQFGANTVGTATTVTSAEPVGVASRPVRFEARLAPIAALAAADLVKATIPFEAGTLRLLQSPLRPDLALELTLDAAFADQFAGCVFMVRLTPSASPLAILAGHSPVFTGASPESFTQASEVELIPTALDGLDAEGITALRRSRRSLRDPVSLDAYDEAIARAEQGRP